MYHRLVTCLRNACIAIGASLTLLQPVAAQSNLSVADFLSLEHQQSKEGVVYWMKRVEEQAAGQLSFTHYPAEQAANAKGILDAILAGTVDIGLVGTLYYTDRLPLNSFLGLPGLYSSALEGTTALQEMLAEGVLYDEFIKEGVVPIFGLAVPAYQVLVRDKRLGAPADWQGVNVRTGGTTQALTVRALGGTGISVPGPETYAALERGRVSAVLFPLSSVNSWKLQEVARYISSNGGFGGFSQILTINKKVFDGLSPELQQLILNTGTETALHLAKAQDDSIADMINDWKTSGVNVYEFTPEENKAITEAVAGVREEWITRVGRQTSQAQQVIEEFESKLDR